MNRTARRFAFWTALLVGFALLWPESAMAAKKVLRLRLDGPLMEAPAGEMDLSALMGRQKARTLHQLLKTLEQAAEDDEIAGIALIIEQPQMSFAQLEEVTRGIKEFRKHGKKVHCYLDYAGNGTYALACAADHITLAEHSELAIVGLNASLSYYKGLLDKIGVEADILHCGAYKSAGEMFYRTEPSKEAAENIDWLLDGIFERWLELMAEGRGMTAKQVRTAVDEAPIPSEKALELKLVDEVSSFPAFKQMIHKKYGKDVEVLKKLKQDDELELDFDNPFAIFEMFGKFLEEVDEPAKPSLALIFIEGSIVTGTNEAGLFGGTSAGSTTLRAAFEKAREDDNIKAVVVRVNSPGGSALASDIMWEAATRCAKEKPLIVSMGGVAGSGGYYVAIPGDVIFAEASTITGSIGVVGGKMIWKELMEDKLGITTTEFPRGKHSGLMSMNRPWTDEERNCIQGYMDSVYTQFKDRVMESRGSRIKGNLEDLAGGRVYTGRQALEHGLVDRIGGLTDAIDYTVKKAGLEEDYEVVVLPRPPEFADIFREMLGEEREDEFEITIGAGGSSDPLLRLLLPLVDELAPDLARGILQDMHNLTILGRERVGCFMPLVPRVR